MLLICSIIIGLILGGVISIVALPPGASLSGLNAASAVLGFNLDSSYFVFSAICGFAACFLGCLILTLRAPLRLVVNVDGALVEEFSIGEFHYPLAGIHLHELTRRCLLVFMQT